MINEEEAIDILQSVEEYFWASSRIQKAFEMAIHALKQKKSAEGVDCLDDFVKCKKCGFYPTVGAYRDIGGYIVMANCYCSSIRASGDIIKQAMDKVIEEWNQQNKEGERL